MPEAYIEERVRVEWRDWRSKDAVAYSGGSDCSEVEYDLRMIGRALLTTCEVSSGGAVEAVEEISGVICPSLRFCGDGLLSMEVEGVVKRFEKLPPGALCCF